MPNTHPSSVQNFSYSINIVILSCVFIINQDSNCIDSLPQILKYCKIMFIISPWLCSRCYSFYFLYIIIRYKNVVRFWFFAFFVGCVWDHFVKVFMYQAHVFECVSFVYIHFSKSEVIYVLPFLTHFSHLNYFGHLFISVLLF